MKTIKFAVIILVTVISSAYTIKQIDSWKIDSNYTIKFSGTKVQGTFSGLKGDIIFNENDLKICKRDIEVDVNTIKTGKDGMDEHAKKDTWFDAAKYPKITFKSLGFTKVITGYSVLGELTMHGVKKPVSITFTFNNKGKEGEFAGVFKINRKDYQGKRI